LKKNVGTIEPVPSKRIFYSIIVDYDLNRAICELIDNALDQWTKAGRRSKLAVSLNFDLNQQTIAIIDDAGGVKKAQLEILVGPGLTSNEPEEHTIGIFGVGTKRAVVALAQDVQIRSRHKSGETFLIEFDETWLQDESWRLDVFSVDPIDPGTTRIDLSRLRFRIKEEDLRRLKNHLGATYSLFLQSGKVNLKVDSETIAPITLENWAYPPSFGPQRFVGALPVDGSDVAVTVVGGLSRESSPASGEYGVYVYCNKRLVGRALKSHHVGFVKGLAGVPHPKVSLVRVIVMLEGEARLMPWNSTKSSINYEHPVFLAMRDWLVTIVKEYATLSRGWQGSWPEQVFKYKTGSILEVQVPDFALIRAYLPPLPKFRPRFADRVEAENRKVFASKPWTRGLSEGMVAVDLISKARLESRNRIALILLDSTLEIAFKEFLVNDSGRHYSDNQIAQIFRVRVDVHAEVRKYKRFTNELWKKIAYYYNLRCKLVHERSTVMVSDAEIDDFRGIAEKVLGSLFQLDFPS
jgi:hypothetical protein